VLTAPFHIILPTVGEELLVTAPLLPQKGLEFGRVPLFSSPQMPSEKNPRFAFSSGGPSPGKRRQKVFFPPPGIRVREVPVFFRPHFSSMVFFFLKVHVLVPKAVGLFFSLRFVVLSPIFPVQHRGTKVLDWCPLLQPVSPYPFHQGCFSHPSRIVQRNADHPHSPFPAGFFFLQTCLGFPPPCKFLSGLDEKLLFLPYSELLLPFLKPQKGPPEIFAFFRDPLKAFGFFLFPLKPLTHPFVRPSFAFFFVCADGRAAIGVVLD